ncbi:MAG: hypothetical protein M0Z65_02655 [Firmicutes bacterium]|nr:hypothetical protein [Bacillota bacterium]
MHFFMAMQFNGGIFFIRYGTKKAQNKEAWSLFDHAYLCCAFFVP